MRAVLVVEAAGDRGSLALSRALAGAGWNVGVATTQPRGLADASRAVTRRHRVPKPEHDLDAFAAAIANAVREGGYQVVLPGAVDSVLLALSLRREEIPARLPLPEHSRLLAAMDKLSLTLAGGRAGLKVPRTAPLGGDEVPPFSFPAVVKQRLHGGSGESTHTRIEAMVVGSPAEARAQAAAIRAAGGAPLLQERAAGRLAAFALVADRTGGIVARVQQVSERTWPLAAGVSARAHTVPVDPVLEAKIAALIRELGWLGLAEVQFIFPEPGEPILIDLNGRAYGSLALATAAGVNLPAIWADLALNGRSTYADAAKPGVRYQWLEGDIRSALAGGTARMRGLRECLAYARGAAHSIWSRRDPRPAGRYLRLRAMTALRNALPGSRSSGMN